MGRILFFVIASYTGFCLLRVHAISCNNKMSVNKAQLICFVEQGIKTDMEKISMVHTLLDSNLTDTCRNKEKYKLAYRCAILIEKQCSSDLGTSPDILPDATKVAQGIDFICQHANDLDEECLKTTGDGMKGCAKIKGLRRFSSVNPTDWTSLSCSYLQTVYDCTKERRQVCSGNTLHIVLDVLNVYFRPPACSSFDNSGNNEENPLTTLAQSTIAPVFIERKSVPIVNCSSMYNIQQAQKECYTQNLPALNGVDARQNKQGSNQGFAFNIENLQTTCSNLRENDRVVECVTQVSQKCLPLFTSFIPTAQNVKLMYKKLCDNINVIDFDCLESSSSRIFQCAFKKGIEYGSRYSGSITDMLCLSFSIATECYLEVLPTCGCLMTKLFVETFKLYLNPPACSPLSMTIPECDSDMYRFM